ncbi:MAG: glycoside hydrolase family 97 catalytic domain-containing protein [Bacteroidota bacterium]
MIEFGKNGVLLGWLLCLTLWACQSNEQNEKAKNTSTVSQQPAQIQQAIKGSLALEASKESWTLISPDQKIQMQITNQSQEGRARQLRYRVTYEDQLVIEPSDLGIRREDEAFVDNLDLKTQSDVQLINTKFQMYSGKRSYLTAQAHELVLSFENTNGAKIDLIARAYNNGVAFRYRFPESSTQKHTVTEELSSFDLPQGRAWLHPYDSVGTYQPAYETYFEHNLQIGQAADGQFNGWAFPALFNIDNGRKWVLISESGLDGQYCGMHFDATATEGHYRLSWPLATEAGGQGSVQPSSTLPWTLPWRFMTIGNTLAKIVESDMAHLLAAPSLIEETSWIKPGVSSWSWWSDSDSPQQYQSLKAFVDFSAEMNWKYTLVDANWDQMKGGDLAKLARYAASKEVGLLVWYNSGGPHNTVTEAPRNRMHEQAQRRAEFKRLQKMGVKGIKVDFWQSDKQWMIQYYLDLLQDAADHQLLVNFHGCTLPRGWSRTYPNLLTMEAVRGGEQYKFDPNFPEKAPRHNTILPFTRNVVGSMDYTPAAFSDAKYKRQTTIGHELALTVLFESGIVHLVDRPDAYLKLPVEAKFLLKYLPTTWDDTRFLLGWPGKEVIIARKKGTLWYVAGINGENKTKKRKVDMRSLDTGLFEIEYTHDGAEKGTLVTDYRQVQSFTPFEITLPPYGGFVMKIRKP